MANFLIAINIILAQEGGYQAYESDQANYVDGVLIGTNYGISAPVLADYWGRVPTQQEMRNLPVETAKSIYKRKFWDKMRGDQIESQEVANLLFDFYVHYPSYAAKSVQSILNLMGNNLVVDGIVGKKTIKAINEADAASLHNSLLKVREKFYRYSASDLVRSDTWYESFQKWGVRQSSSNMQWLNGWLNQLKDFPALPENSATPSYLIASISPENANMKASLWKWLRLGGVVVGVAIVGFFIIKHSLSWQIFRV